MPDDSDFVKKEVELVKPLLENYGQFRNCLNAILEEARKKQKINAIIQTRTKEISSFAEKCIRKRKQYPKPSYMLTDLCGARIIVESKDQIEVFSEFIREYFEIDESKSQDVAERLQDQEFGYQSVHFIISFKDAVNYPGIDKVPPVLLEQWNEEDAKNKGVNIGPKYKAEIQVRTLLQHVWATMVHDTLYKSELKKKPRHLVRLSGLISAALENADNSFVELIQGVDSYQTCFGAYLKPKEIEDEIKMQKIIQQHNKESEKQAHKIAQLAIAIEKWEEAINVLEPFKDSEIAVVRRDLGWAIWKNDNKNNDEYKIHLKRAKELDPSDPDTSCCLGDIFYEKKERWDALESYKQAYEKSPDYPRAIQGYVLCEIVANRKIDFLQMMRPGLKKAIKVSQEWASYGMHLPWAYYDIGFFTLLLGNPFESLTAYAMAVHLTSSVSEISKIQNYLKEVQYTAKSHILGEYSKWARWFLSAALVAKEMAKEDECKKNKVEAEYRKLQIENKLAKLKENESGDLKKIKDTEEELKKAEDELKKADQAQAEVNVPEALKNNIFNGDPTFDGSKRLATETEEESLFDKDKPIVIVAGGCDIKFRNRIENHRKLIESAFDGYSGTIISGGTTAGIPGIVGDLPNPDKKMKKIAYLPLKIPKDDKIHDGYDTSRTSSMDNYSPLEPIQVWIDLLASGIRPKNVHLLGINGGNISSCEFRLALVMGAKVAILRDSGRAAGKIAKDPDWNNHPGLFFLPTDQESITAFIQPSQKSTLIKENEREEMARIAHEEFRKNQEGRYLKEHPPIAEWENLRETYQEANRKQIDHIETKLQRIGLSIRRVENPKLYSFSKKQQRILAEMEHGRWTVERLLNGWRLGPKKNEEGKIHPNLISWNDLGDHIKEYDFDAVKKIPEELAKIGVEICEP